MDFSYLKLKISWIPGVLLALGCGYFIGASNQWVNSQIVVLILAVYLLVSQTSLLLFGFGQRNENVSQLLLSYCIHNLGPLVLFSLVGEGASYEKLGIFFLFAFGPVTLSYLSLKMTGFIKWLLLIGAAVMVWFPLEFKLLDGVWVLSDSQDLKPLNVLVGINALITAFTMAKQKKSLSLPLTFTKINLTKIVVYSVIFFMIAIPVGFFTDFLVWNPRFEPANFFGTLVLMLFFVAIPEELLFRAALFHLAEKICKHSIMALYIVSIGFGFSHLNNEPFYSPIYVVLASYAGFLYGHIFWKTGNLMNAAILHVIVNMTWFSLFMK